MALTVDFPMPMDPVSPSLLGESFVAFVDMFAAPRRSADARAGDRFARERVGGGVGGARDDAAPRRMRRRVSQRVESRRARTTREDDFKVWNFFRVIAKSSTNETPTFC
jgi:hypothetical protein